MINKGLAIRIQKEIIPYKTMVSKANGKERRLVTSNEERKIGMKTGVKTNQTKSITYDMVQYALDTLNAKGCFGSSDFRAGFGDKYRSAPCRFSMTGGILVELGLARQVQMTKTIAVYKKLN